MCDLVKSYFRWQLSLLIPHFQMQELRHQAAPSPAPPQAQCHVWLSAAGLRPTRQKFGSSSLQKSREPSQNLLVSQFFPTCLSHLLTWGFYLVSTSPKFWFSCPVSGQKMNKICWLLFLVVYLFSGAIMLLAT